MSSSAKKTYLGDYVDFQNGYAFKSSDYTDKGHYLIRIKNVQQGFIEINDECFVNIPSDAKFEKFKLKNGDIVVSLTGNVGRIARIKDVHLPAVLNQRVASVAPKSEKVLSPEYLYYLLRTPEFLEFAIGSGKGAAQQNISTSDMEKYQVSIPSLEKQVEIVKKLHSTFAEIDLLEENLVLGDAKANQLLQSLLSSAFNQSSTNSEQSNLSATKDLDIKQIKLVDLCKLVGGGTPSKANSNYYSGEIPWATVRDMRSRWLEDTEHKINEVAVKESSTNVIPSGNVVLASRVGLGKVIQLKQDTAINQDLRALIPRENSKIDSNYLYYWTLSITPEIIAAGKGATVQGVTLPFLENLLVPLPSLDKQVEIVKKLDSAFGEIELLKARIKNEKDYVVALRQSLLNSAFTHGDLVA
jgi:type I restriction enzyme S subunit